jgi:hypothetical protein
MPALPNAAKLLEVGSLQYLNLWVNGSNIANVDS